MSPWFCAFIAIGITMIKATKPFFPCSLFANFTQSCLQTAHHCLCKWHARFESEHENARGVISGGLSGFGSMSGVKHFAQFEPSGVKPSALQAKILDLILQSAAADAQKPGSPRPILIGCVQRVYNHLLFCAAGDGVSPGLEI
jgi:hypothetical protein